MLLFLEFHPKRLALALDLLSSATFVNTPEMHSGQTSVLRLRNIRNVHSSPNVPSLQIEFPFENQRAIPDAKEAGKFKRERDKSKVDQSLSSSCVLHREMLLLKEQVVVRYVSKNDKA